MPPIADRRFFLKLAGAGVGAAWLAARWPDVLAAGDAAAEARAADRGYSTLDPDDARDLAAIAERILPSDDTPGAREAGVIWFMDAVLGDVMAERKGTVLDGLAMLNRRAAAAGAPDRFSSLDEKVQVRLLKVLEGEPFFETVRFMTLAGMFAMPDYGGNRGHAGWSMIGLEHAHGWQPPFGHYDAKAVPSREDNP